MINEDICRENKFPITTETENISLLYDNIEFTKFQVIKKQKGNFFFIFEYIILINSSFINELMKMELKISKMIYLKKSQNQ